MTAISLDRTAIKPVLGSWFGAVTGLEPRDREDRQSWAGTWNASRTGAPIGAYGKLFLKTTKTIGVDRLYFEDRVGQPLGSELIPHIQGARELLWEVQVWSITQNPAGDAHKYLEDVRNKLRGHTTRELFRTVGIGLMDLTGSRDLTKAQISRRYSIGQIDVTFNAFVDVEDTAIGYVERFEVETEWKDSGGVLLPSSLQFQGEISV